MSEDLFINGSENAYGDGLHDVPAQLGLERKVVNNTPPSHNASETSSRDVLGCVLGQLIALVLDICHGADLARSFTQTHAQIVCPVRKARYTYADLLWRAFNLNSELLPSRGIPDKVADLG